MGRSWLITPRRVETCGPVLSLSAPGVLTGEQTKALVTQLTLFNQILVELRDDIRDQVRARQRGVGTGLGGGVRGADRPRLSVRQVKEMSLIRNAIMECQVCGEWARGEGSGWHPVPPTPRLWPPLLRMGTAPCGWL